MNNTENTKHLISILGLFAIATGGASAGIVAFNTAGPISYSYTAAANTPLTPDAAASSNVVVGTYSAFSADSGVTGITTNDINPGTLLWHFKAGSGLVFGNDVNLNIGSGCYPSGTIVAEYSTDGVTFTQWDRNVDIIDQSFPQASNVAAGATDLYVRFTLTGSGSGSQVLTWGGDPGDRAFVLNGSVVNVPVNGSNTIPSGPAELPTLEKPWLGYFGVAIESGFQFRFASQGETQIYILNCNRDPFEGLPINVVFLAVQTLPDGTSKDLPMQLKTLESTDPATAKLKKTVFRSKLTSQATGQPTLEVTIEVNGGAILASSRIIDKGAFDQGSLIPVIRVGFPGFYGNENAEKGTWTKKELKEF
jgi:hypothetical protein